MSGVRAASLLAVLLGAAATAAAQPVDPYAQPAAPTPPAPPPTTPTAQPSQAAQDPQIAEHVAASLVDRAQYLLDAQRYADAKQLAVEALVNAPIGPSASHAQRIIKAANDALGITVKPVEPVDPDIDPETGMKRGVIEHRNEPPVNVPIVAVDRGHPVPAAVVHGALYGGIVGAAIGSFFANNEAAGAVPTGIALGAGTAALGWVLADHFQADEAQVRTIGSGILWGGVIGASIAGTAQGANGGTTHGHTVLLGGAIGATLGGLGGISYALHHKLTRGDVALTDTFAGIGAVGGLSLGLLMQPAQREAYALNAALGAAAGVVTGVIAGPLTNTTPRRMLRVAGLAAAGGAVPYLIYAADHKSSAAQRTAGGLSCLGLVGGAWLGFYLTRDVDRGLDLPEKSDDDAPVSVIGRSSSGRWALGGIGMAPLSPQLTTDHGAALSLVGGSF